MVKKPDPTKDSNQYTIKIEPTRPHTHIIDSVMVSVSIAKINNEYHITYYFSDTTNNVLKIVTAWDEVGGGYTTITRNIPSNELIYNKEDISYVVSYNDSLPVNLKILSITPLYPTKIRYTFK